MKNLNSKKLNFFAGIFTIWLINFAIIRITKAQMTFSDGWGKRSASVISVESPSSPSKLGDSNLVTLSNGNNKNVISILKAIQMAPEEGSNFFSCFLHLLAVKRIDLLRA